MKPIRPKIVVFDLGKVLLDFDYRTAVRRLLPRLSGTAEDVQRLINQSPLLFEYESGQIDNREFFRRIQAAAGYAGDFDEFAAGFAGIFTEIAPMIALHDEVRRRGFPTYIFSNTNDLAVEHIRERFPFFRHFTGYILSYEVKSMKPAPAIYEALEQLSGARGSQIFYLDDRSENVEAAWQRGWQGAIHVTPEESRAALQAVGVVA